MDSLPSYQLAPISPLKLFVISALSLVALVLSGPIIIELILTVVEKVGFPKIRLRDDVLDWQMLAIKYSDRVEYLITAAVVAGLLSAMYFHITELINDRDASYFHLVVFHAIPSFVINANMFYFFYQAVMRDPGKPEDIGDSEGGKRCRLCASPQPARAHHCVTCDRCVLYMDHHCPFTSNCVGQENYPFFFGWVSWSWVATVYAMWLSYDPYMFCQSDEGKLTPQCTGNLKRGLFIASILFCVIISGFMLFVIFLLARGQTARAFLNSEVVDPFSEFRQRGVFFCLQYRLGPWRSWWRYVVPFALRRKIKYESSALK